MAWRQDRLWLACRVSNARGHDTSIPPEKHRKAASQRVTPRTLVQQRTHSAAAMLACAAGSRDSAVAHKGLIWCARRTWMHGLGGVSQGAAAYLLMPPQGAGRTEPAGYGERDSRAPGCAPRGGAGLEVLTFGPGGRVRTDHQFVA